LDGRSDLGVRWLQCFALTTLFAMNPLERLSLHDFVSSRVCLKDAVQVRLGSECQAATRDQVATEPESDFERILGLTPNKVSYLPYDNVLYRPGSPSYIRNTPKV
jgi:hypothetical protein